MEINEILKAYKNKSLEIEFDNLDVLDLNPIEKMSIYHLRYLSSLDMKFALIYFNDHDKKNFNIWKDNKEFFIEDIVKKYSDGRFLTSLGMKEEDFSYNNMKKLSESEKTKKLLKLLESYEKYVQLDAIRNLRSSINFPKLENVKPLETTLIEDEKQEIQARIEIYKYLTETPEIKEKYNEFRSYIFSRGDVLLELLKTKNIEKLLDKKTKNVKNKYDPWISLKEEVPVEDIKYVVDILKEISTKFEIPYENMIYELETLDAGKNELEFFKKFREGYEDLLEEEIKQEKQKAIEEENARKEKERQERERKEKERIELEIKNSKLKTEKEEKITLESGESKEYKNKIQENENFIGPREHVKVRFLSWFFRNGKRLKENLGEEELKAFLNDLKELSKQTKEKISIFIFSDETEENCRTFIKDLEENIKKASIDNKVFVEGMTGMHGAFLIDRERKKHSIYELPKEIYDKLLKLNDKICENLSESIDSENTSYIKYKMKLKKKETVKDYANVFNARFRFCRDKFLYLYDEKNSSLIELVRGQYPPEVKKKVIEYYKSKYYFSEEDIIDGKSNENRER